MRGLKAYKIKQQISDLDKELEKHQKKCKHHRATREFGANQGNYDPSSDCYWTTFSCPTCLKVWTEDGTIH